MGSWAEFFILATCSHMATKIIKWSQRPQIMEECGARIWLVDGTEWPVLLWPECRCSPWHVTGSIEGQGLGSLRGSIWAVHCFSGASTWPSSSSLFPHCLEHEARVSLVLYVYVTSCTERIKSEIFGASNA
jgi:hypothetical protein